MSEPDAVPLPREGAVFFDVRGEARSMRLSWYADSAVAVFSIWQANRCTGTFRLPFADLARMVHTLQSGPRAYQEPPAWNGAAAPATHAYAASPVHPHAAEPGYAQAPGYGNGPAYEPGYGDQGLADYDPPNYQDAPRYADGYSAPGQAGHGGYESAAGYAGHGGYERAGYERTGDYRAPQQSGSGMQPGDHGPRHPEPGYESTEHDLPSFPSVPARTGQSAADWASTDWSAATAAYPGS